jgi:hypothetical protein
MIELHLKRKFIISINSKRENFYFSPGGIGCSRRHSGQRNERARGSTRFVKHGIKQNVCIHGKSFGVRNLSKQTGHVVRRSI